MKKEIREKARAKYKSLSIVERNAYEELVERRKQKFSFLQIPYMIFYLIFQIGIFLIVFCYVADIDLEIFREVFTSIASTIIPLILPLMGVILIFQIINYFKVRRFKIKLLTT